MLEAMSTIAARGSNVDGDGLSPTAVDLLITLLVLLFVALSLVAAVLLLRRRRQNRNQPLLPLHNGQTVTSQHGRDDSVPVMDEKRALMENELDSPKGPVPEIRLTFPEEEDGSGKRTSGRVVVVKMSEGGNVGLEPYQEQLPPYQAPNSDNFHSLDLERMGGLKEKDDPHMRF